MNYEAAVRFCPRDGTALLGSEQVLAGKFILGQELGVGGMGVVYKAVQLPMGRTVAVKLLHRDMTRNEDAIVRFEREARAASSISHPNTVTIYDSGRTEEGQAYLAMEYLEGEDLGKVLARETRLATRRAMELWLPVVDAMAAAHDGGIIHRDLKPENIFLARQQVKGGLKEQVKLLDFGIAKILQQGGQWRQTRPNTMMGTLLYMSPEQLAGSEASRSSDVYALGLILVEMLTGRLPWPEGDDSALAPAQRMVQPPRSLHELCSSQTFSPELQQLLDEVLALDSRLRPADAGELISRMRRIGVPEVADILPPGTAPPGTRQPDAQEVKVAQAPKDAEPVLADNEYRPGVSQLMTQADTSQPGSPTLPLPLPLMVPTSTQEPVTEPVTAPVSVPDAALPDEQVTPVNVPNPTMEITPVIGEDTLPLAQPAWHPDAVTAHVTSPELRASTAELSAQPRGRVRLWLVALVALVVAVLLPQKWPPRPQAQAPAPARPVKGPAQPPAASRPAVPPPAKELAEPVLHVVFALQGPPGILLSCGQPDPTERLRPTCIADGPCEVNVDLTAHDRCKASHSGFRSRWFDYGTLRSKYRPSAGKIRVTVNLRQADPRP